MSKTNESERERESARKRADRVRKKKQKLKWYTGGHVTVNIMSALYALICPHVRLWVCVRDIFPTRITSFTINCNIPNSNSLCGKSFYLQNSFFFFSLAFVLFYLFSFFFSSYSLLTYAYYLFICLYVAKWQTKQHVHKCWQMTPRIIIMRASVRDVFSLHSSAKMALWPSPMETTQEG